MNFLKRGICILLAVSLIFSIASCGNTTTDPTKHTSSKKPGTSSSETNTSSNSSTESSNTSGSTEDNYDDSYYNDEDNIYEDDFDMFPSRTEHRKPYVAPVEVKPEKFIDTDGIFNYKTTSWNGPDGYSIVIPNEDYVKNTKSELYRTAQNLQKFFKKQSDVTVNIISDSKQITAKEILIGKTNRTESNKSLSDAELEVSVKNGKLVFDGGHFATVRAAVDKFIRLAPAKNKAVVFSLKTDFKSTVPGGYEYVWGDEFEGDDIDFTKWAFDGSMVGSTTIITSNDKDVANCADGRLKLHAYREFNPELKGSEFKIANCLSTVYNMNYTYGYAEIRARVPACDGAFPAWWCKTTANLGGTMSKDLMGEIDIFEAFGNEIRCTLHKWYRDFDFNGFMGADFNQHTDLNSNRYRGEYNLAYQADSYKFFSEQYHIYGFEWTPEYFAMSVDGEVYAKIDITESYDEYPNGPVGFHETVFTIFDNWIIDRSSGSTKTVITDSLDELPTCFYIDYYRLYQKPGVGILNTDFTDNSHRFPTRK